MAINRLQAQDKIQRVMKAYQDALRGTSSATSAAIEAPVDNILPTYFDVFKKNNEDPNIIKHLPNSLCYDVGIFLVGYSSIPIVLSIAAIQPRQEIYFLHSKGTDYIVAEIQERIKTMLGSARAFKSLIKHVEDAKTVGIKNPSDPVDTFKEIKSIVNAVGDKRIALDLTGGKKPMLGGGFTAAAILRFANSIRSSACDMFYVDSTKYNEKIGAPTPGTEFLTQLKNPYDIYNVQTVQRAEELFSKHNYEAAANLWKDVEEKLQSHVKQFSLEDEQKAVQSDLGMAHCYRLWDAFDYERAKDCKVFSSSGSRDIFWGYNEEHTHNGIDVLDILSKVSDRKTLFKKEERVIHYAVDRYQNAIRRKESGKFYDAIVRFAQVIEMICGYKICRGIYIVCGKEIPQDFLDDHGGITTLIQFFFGSPGRYRNHLSVDDEEFLQLTDYGCYTVEDMTKFVKYRHEFVHVLRATTLTETNRNTKNLQELARKFLKDFSCSYCCTKGLSFEDLLELHKFRLASLSPVEQLVEELNGLTCSRADENYATQIYNEKLQSFEGKNQQMIAAALKTYWKGINKWESSSLSDKQREKVNEIQLILNEELNEP